MGGRLEGRSAIVTGAGSGIGRAIAERFAREGARVMVAEVEADAGAACAEAIGAAGGVAEFAHTDVADEASVLAMAAAAERAFGGVDVLVNNAAAFVFGTVETVTRADWERVFAVNVIGYASCVRAVLPFFRRAGRGAVVNLASVSSFVAQPAFVPYNASKGAVAQLTRCLAMDLAPLGVRVNAVCPGAIRTRATDRHIASLGMERERAYREFGDAALLKRMGTPEEVAAAALFLASDEASYVTGALLVVDGGATID
jgi:NAD(P)-dependent dehydrogenase (short-subunit alcohol dehydrogenase family)